MAKGGFPFAKKAAGAAKGKPSGFAGKRAPPFGGGGGRGAPDPDAAQDTAGFRRGGKVKRK